MHHNDVKNVKSRYKMLYDMNSKEDIWDTEKDVYVKLEKILMEAKSDKEPLFLAVAQGAGRYKNDANVVVNPHTRDKARI